MTWWSLRNSGDIYKETAAYLCVKVHTRSGQARVALQNLNGLGKAFLKTNEMSIMKELERAQEKGDISYKHYSKDDYMMVAMHKGASE
ncbi:hypothetical protein [Bacillus thuringiensis]|uniref:hypothetical protein n=1 Tax=Bacillus thuringiensis TaxID=1428 RepID=UPI000BFA669C|nr:hypothetical protein [Bacillus thuringiensis]PET15036.1 hypothetical protein CN517_26050 [Bacillus thuringiensis]